MEGMCTATSRPHEKSCRTGVRDALFSSVCGNSRPAFQCAIASFGTNDLLAGGGLSSVTAASGFSTSASSLCSKLHDNLQPKLVSTFPFYECSRTPFNNLNGVGGWMMKRDGGCTLQCMIRVMSDNEERMVMMHLVVGHGSLGEG